MLVLADSQGKYFDNFLEEQISIWDISPGSADKPMLYSDAVCIAVMHKLPVQHCVEEPCKVPDMLCHTTFPPLPVSPRPVRAPRPVPVPAVNRVHRKWKCI